MPKTDIIYMARTNAIKRESELAAGADRQAKRRGRMKSAGRPDTQACDRSLVEALSFKFSEVLRDVRDQSDGDRDEAARRMAAATVGMSTLAALACQILVDRYGYDRRETVKAIHLRIAKRDEHEEPSFVPSLNPDLAAQAARMEAVRQARCLTDVLDTSLVEA